MAIGIIGAGAVGTAFARALARAGIEATISNSLGPDSLEALGRELAPRSTDVAGSTAAIDLISARSPAQRCRRLM
jgi:8-hydroxy-5-deazaflavin:NADPH oxidoreductase